MVVFVAACGEAAPAAPVRASDAVVVVDDAGRAVAVSPTPARIVSLLPSATDVLVALGAADRLVARTSYDADPALAGLPSLGRTLAPSVEAIVALHPDLVIAGPGVLTHALTERLASLGLRVYEADAQRLEAVLATVDRLGALVGAAARADSLRRAIRTGLDSLRAATVGAGRSVVYAVWHAPAQVAGAETYVDDVLRAAGGVNAFGDLTGWPEVSAEALVRRDPDVIVVPRGRGHSLQPEWLRATPGWRELRAVRDGRLVVVDSDLFNRPGPRILDAARTLASALRRLEAP